ncbi:phosphatase PAP2 family protein [Shewanella acanthi]|nr:phosphatase PAP2 family protein [Shewanella acanthi]
MSIVSGCSSSNSAKAEPTASVPEIMPGYLIGYVPQKELPNSLLLLPPPPAEGSPAFALDETVAREMVQRLGTPRWNLATADAQLGFPYAAGTFSCAIKAPISEALTPRLYTLLRRTLTDAGLSTYAAKEHYQRTRPFVINGAPICTPEEAEALKKDGSYPSGHTAIGWAWALVLSEVSPENADAIIARGLAFGESRNVCNVHWHSDIVQGRTMAAATVAKMHSVDAFRADVEAAKAELKAVRAQNLAPSRDCADEAAGLSNK